MSLDTLRTGVGGALDSVDSGRHLLSYLIWVEYLDKEKVTCGVSFTGN